MITPHPSWQIVDPTKINDYLTCARYYFFRHILGWRRESRNRNDLAYGKAWHCGMARLLEGWGKEDIGPLVADCYREFVASYREEFPEETDELFPAKNPEMALLGLASYAGHWNEDDFEVLHNEVSGSVPISDSDSLHFRVDAIVRNRSDKKVVVLEHKTGSRWNQAWADQWSLSIQVGCYLHVAMCLYGDEVWGAKVNGAFFKKSGVEFHRVPVVKTPEMMQVWLATVQHYYNAIKMGVGFLSRHPESNQQTLNTWFSLNPMSCTKYYGCQYLDFCTSWANPLEHAENVPAGFIQEFWDPRENERKAREVRHL